MKKIIYFSFALIISILFSSCTENDDEFFATKSVTVNNLIEVETSSNILSVSCNFDRILNVGNVNPLDLYLTTESRYFFFNFSLQKLNESGTWTYVFPENISENEGDNVYGNYISAIQELNSLDAHYEYDTDFILDPGEYRIEVEPRLVSTNSQNAVSIAIKTSTIGAVGNVLEFTIN
ncbi:hypothetical protein GFJ94_03740 [Flavobacterium sp. LMO8]|uniref:hypothetical protein n=1 Tax=Flavobacterium sp. LMO8 TaxID=2654244 RepID=UPI001292A347|nr:hypothetical protein [Flavobacterium sp. LMO8]MQP24173.1 hypothetical protein [Flavobacterium sp. LMO8]